MAKRFTDTEKWDRPWFRNLSVDHKLLWYFILDKCNIAGVWYVDLEMAGFMLKTTFDYDGVLEAFLKQIVTLDDGARWWIKDFPRFQYSSLRPNVRLHASVINIMSQYDEMKKEVDYLLSSAKPLVRVRQGLDNPCLTLKDKDKDKDKDKEGGYRGKQSASPDGLFLADKLKVLILLNNPNARVPLDLNSWGLDADLMIKNDNRTIESIKAVMEFSQRDQFWMKNILSMGKLRKQFDQLYMKAGLAAKPKPEPKEDPGYKLARDIIKMQEGT